MTYLSPYKTRLNALNWPAGFGGLDTQLDSLFASLPSFFALQDAAKSAASSGVVKTRWYEKDDAYLVRLDLPGVKKGDISLELEDGTLTVSATRKTESEKEAAETAAGFEYRTVFEVPDGVQEDKIEASYEDGVLNLSLPKSEKVQPRQISVSFGK